MIVIRFPNINEKRRALAYLAGRFPFKSCATGEMLIQEMALPELAAESIHFSVEGSAKYQQHIPAVPHPSAIIN